MGSDSIDFQQLFNTKSIESDPIDYIDYRAPLKIPNSSLMKLLAIRLSEQTTLAKSLVIPRRRESRLIKHLVPRLRGDDGIFRGALNSDFTSNMIFSRAGSARRIGLSGIARPIGYFPFEVELE